MVNGWMLPVWILREPLDACRGAVTDHIDSVAKIEGEGSHARLGSGRLADKSRTDDYDDDGGDRHYGGDGIVGDDDYD